MIKLIHFKIIISSEMPSVDHWQVTNHNAIRKRAQYITLSVHCFEFGSHIQYNCKYICITSSGRIEPFNTMDKYILAKECLYRENFLPVKTYVHGSNHNKIYLNVHQRAIVHSVRLHGAFCEEMTLSHHSTITYNLPIF